MASSGKSGIATAMGLRGKSPNELVVPEDPHVDPSEQQILAAKGNLAVLPLSEQLAQATNDAQARQFVNMMEKLIPGFSEISKTIAGNIGSMVSGHLPKDVEQRIGRWSAERGISRGTGGSQFDDYGAVRDLGLTSLEMTDRGLNSAQRWMGSQPKPFNVTAMFLSPTERIATEQWNEVNRFNAQFMRNQISMLPSNSDTAWAQVLDYIADFATIAASYGASSAMGGGKGGGGMQQPQQQNFSGNDYMQPYSQAEMADVYGKEGPGY